ncbi:MAG TPA: winged helix-turn-helix domain-containing protein [Kofleriaceae bacterium]|nr:winged helix-turn-helix domain-containing protein [Kofleriaceae bacterium]
MGREAELDRLVEASSRVPVVLICGVAGVGKSTLASAFAATWPGPVVSSALAGETLAELVDDVRRMLGPPAVDIGSVAERLRGLAARLDEAAGLWLIDDLHRLAPADRRLGFRVLGQSLRRGRVLITSRERVGVDAGGPDHAELRLGGLADADARRLWLLLDGLYGPAGGFEVAMARSGGNPFLLRRGHAGNLSDEDPLGDSVAGLSPAERRVAGALALSENRLPFELIARLLGADDAREVVRRLVDRMMIEIHPDGALSMHDLVRDAMLRSLEADERAALHGDLALLLPDSSLDPARRARSVCRHLCALDRHEEAARYLIERGSELDKFGAAGELLRGLAAIPKERRSPEASAALARASARAFDLARAYAEHERLLGAGVGPQVELALVHALLALLTGRPAVADASLDRIAQAGELAPAMQIRALTTRAMVRAYSGEPGEAAASLLGAIPRATGPATEAPVWLYLAFVLTTEERDTEAYEAIRRALVLRGENALSYRSSVLASTVLAAIAGALGHFDEAEAALDEARQLMAGDEDVLLTTYVRYTRAALLAERGDWVEALEALRALVDLFRQGGHLVGELSGAALRGRILLVMGRRSEALGLLDECRAAASQRGLPGIERAVERALACDPARLLGGAAELKPGVAAAGGRAGTRVWHRLAGAIRLAAAGEIRRASAVVAAEAALPDRPGHELGRVLAAVAEAVIAMVGGDSTAVQTHLSAARAQAAAAGIDEDLVTVLLAALGPLRVVSAAGSRITSGADLTIGPDDRVVDARSHELRAGAQTVSLLRRPMLRRLLYGLARRRGVVVSKDELAAALWSRDYHPLSDHGPLKSNIANLRKLIERAGLSIDFDDDGYRLLGAERLIYIEPISWPPG